MALKSLFRLPAELEWNAFHPQARQMLGDYAFLRIGDDLVAMAVALLGALLARRLFERSSTLPEPEPSTMPTARMRWIRPTVAIWAVLILTTSLLAMRPTGPSGLWAGLAFLLVFGLLGLAAVGAFQATGRLRRSCAGAAMLGGGYLLLVFSHSPYQPLPSGQFLHAFRIWFPMTSGPNAAASARLLDELERPIALEFPRPTPLSEVLSSIKNATASPGHPGYPTYVDPIGLQEAEQPPDPTIAIDLRGVPLKVTLRTALRPIQMDYVVRDGVLWITAIDSEYLEYDPFQEAWMQVYEHGSHQERMNLASSADLEDPYLIAGHCLLALAAAGLGALAGPILSRTNGRPTSDPGIRK